MQSHCMKGLQSYMKAVVYRRDRSNQTTQTNIICILFMCNCRTNLLKKMKPKTITILLSLSQNLQLYSCKQSVVSWDWTVLADSARQSWTDLAATASQSGYQAPVIFKHLPSTLSHISIQIRHMWTSSRTVSQYFGRKLVGRPNMSVRRSNVAHVSMSTISRTNG